jgi:cbb3-type cytochrome oxidase maturation protein
MEAMMEVLVILVPLALGLGLAGLLGFLWSLKSGQYDDLEGAAWRAISDDEPVATLEVSDLGGHPAEESIKSGVRLAPQSSHGGDVPRI